MSDVFSVKRLKKLSCVDAVLVNCFILPVNLHVYQWIINISYIWHYYTCTCYNIIGMLYEEF